MIFHSNIEVEIGFERAVYSVDEGETVLVCVRLTGPEVIDVNLLAFAVIKTVPGTATGMVHKHIQCYSLFFISHCFCVHLTENDDFVVLNDFVDLTSEIRRRCYSVETLADVVFEGTENLTVTLQPDRLFTPSNVIVNGDEATILISEC